MFPVLDNSTGGEKYAGRSVAKVTANIDPLKKGRIRVKHPFLGESPWIEYLRLPGQFWVPEVDDLVYVEVDAGWIEHPIAWGNLTNSEEDLIPESFKRHKPSNRGMFSPGGHLLELDDGTGTTGTEQKGVRITSSDGKKLHFLEDSSASENKILIEDESGNKIEIDSSNETLTINLSSGNIEITNNAATLSFEEGAISLENGQGSLIIDETGKVELKGASDGVVALIQEFAQELSTDTFAGFGAPAGKAAIYAAIAQRAATILAS